jgi:hypothetical protein
VNDKYNFWIYTDVYETNSHVIHKPCFTIEDGKLKVSDSVEDLRNIISDFHTVEIVSKQQHVYLNYLKLLVKSTRMLFTIDNGKFGPDDLHTRTRDRKTYYKIQPILAGPDITQYVI